ncbi:hypothetical protein EG327_000705 [Venturia inaequalis]|uniref:Cell wall protein n=1 Tax=Venturia inaequalis TaxID=5025 RepID=A0A8H3VQ81_VENIN|nr:hypothetical protein EG327_000705 [Venturia inaequalis]
MYFSTALLFALGSTTLASPAANQIQARDAATLMSAITMVSTAVNGLDTAVKALNSPTDTVALGNIATMGQAVGDTVKTAQAMVEGTDAINLISALKIMTTATALTDGLIATTGDLVQKKPILDQAGLSPVVGMMLMMQQSTSGGFSDAVTDKLPAVAKALAQGSSQKVNDALADAIAVYMTPPAAGSAGGAGGAGGATPAAAAAAGTNGTADATPATDGSGNVSPSPMVSGDTGNSTSNILDNSGNSTSNILDNSGNSTANANKRRHMVVRLRV